MQGAIIFFIIAAAVIFGPIIAGRVLDKINIPKSNISEATVTGKSAAGESDEGDGTGAGMNRPLIGTYHLSFEFGNRRGVTFPVPKNVYNGVSIGSKGVLLYIYTPMPIKNQKGFPIYTYKRFRAFHVDKTLAEIVNPYKAAERSSRRNK